MGALVRYLHATTGFLVKSTWLGAIKAGNYASWPGLTYTNASKCFPPLCGVSQGELHPIQAGHPVYQAQAHT